MLQGAEQASSERYAITACTLSGATLSRILCSGQRLARLLSVSLRRPQALIDSPGHDALRDDARIGPVYEGPPERVVRRLAKRKHRHNGCPRLHRQPAVAVALQELGGAAAASPERGLNCTASPRDPSRRFGSPRPWLT